jgi:SPP1 gp7 family putative phage head morphogenesis protein|nr:MAG TPA: minor capsid protein [Caudoviricetes sp.]
MNYWEKRFERLKRQQMGKAEAVTAAMRREYVKALTSLRKEVLDWYYRYAEENEITLADARKELDTRELKAFRLTLKEYIKLAKKKDLSQKYIKMLDKASIRARLDRSQELYIKTSRYVEELAKSQNLSMNRLLANVYEDSVYKTAYEAQKLKGEFSTFKGVAKQDIETAVSKPWASDGKDFSGRIWDNKTQLMNTLQTEMTRSFMIGEGVAPLINRIQKRFNVSFSNARRLVETETAYVQEKAMLDTYDALDVEQYQILAVLDLKTSDICRHLDKKVFDRKDAKPGITMPPFHCYCRSTTIPYIEGITDNQEDARAARDLLTGKTIFVEGDLNYDEWYNKYVKSKLGEKEVQFICDIPKEIYKVVTPNIRSKAVIITENQIRHIRNRHPNDYEQFSGYFAEALKDPDYILADSRLNTALVLSEILEGNVKIKVALRLQTVSDPPGYENSIITAQKISDKRYRQYVRNGEILYQKKK